MTTKLPIETLIARFLASVGQPNEPENVKTLIDASVQAIADVVDIDISGMQGSRFVEYITQSDCETYIFSVLFFRMHEGHINPTLFVSMLCMMSVMSQRAFKQKVQTFDAITLKGSEFLTMFNITSDRQSAEHPITWSTVRKNLAGYVYRWRILGKIGAGGAWVRDSNGDVAISYHDYGYCCYECFGNVANKTTQETEVWTMWMNGLQANATRKKNIQKMLSTADIEKKPISNESLERYKNR